MALTHKIEEIVMLWLRSMLLSATILATNPIELLANEGFPDGFFEGAYTVIGREPDTGELYEGSVQITSQGEKLQLQRVVRGMITQAVGRLEDAAGGDASVLRSRFETSNGQFEVTYTIGADLDNNPRLSGYVYRVDGSSTKVGMETLFATRSRP